MLFSKKILRYKNMAIRAVLLFFLMCTMVANATGGVQLDQAFAEHFAEDWIASWNAHDLEKILSHYTDDFEMTSPNIVRRNLNGDGTLRGKAAMREYWGPAVRPGSTLKFTLMDTLVAMDSITLYYKSQNGRMAAEVFFFNADGLVYKAFAHYSLSMPARS